MARVLKQNWVRLGYSLVEQPFPRPWSRAHWPGNRPTWQGGAFRGRQPPRRPWQSPRSLVRIPLYGFTELPNFVFAFHCYSVTAVLHHQTHAAHKCVALCVVAVCFLVFFPLFFLLCLKESTNLLLSCAAQARSWCLALMPRAKAETTL